MAQDKKGDTVEKRFTAVGGADMYEQPFERFSGLLSAAGADVREKVFALLEVADLASLLAVEADPLRVKLERALRKMRKAGPVDHTTMEAIKLIVWEFLAPVTGDRKKNGEFSLGDSWVFGRSPLEKRYEADSSEIAWLAEAFGLDDRAVLSSTPFRLERFLDDVSIERRSAAREALKAVQVPFSRLMPKEAKSEKFVEGDLFQIDLPQREVYDDVVERKLFYKVLYTPEGDRLRPLTVYVAYAERSQGEASEGSSWYRTEEGVTTPRKSLFALDKILEQVSANLPERGSGWKISVSKDSSLINDLDEAGHLPNDEILALASSYHDAFWDTQDAHLFAKTPVVDGGQRKKK